MTELPVTNFKPPPNTTRRFLVHSFRIAIFVSILSLIRFVQQHAESFQHDLSEDPLAAELISNSLAGSKLGTFDENVDGNLIVNEVTGKRLGYVLQTSPASDRVIGYSGPTNCLIVLDLDHKIESVSILSSRDTIDHVAAVKRDSDFFASFRGLGFETTDVWQKIDGVSGATLTSYAVIASVANRLGGSAPSLKFQPEPKLECVRKLFQTAAKIERGTVPSQWLVFDQTGKEIGSLLSTTPAADHLSGYQGPTATLVGFDLGGKISGLAVNESYDNEPYATYLDDDYSFQGLYQGKTLEDLSQMDPVALRIEGVSGATMTSVSVAEGLALAAKLALRGPVPSETVNSRHVLTRNWISYWPDAITVLLTLLGICFSFSNLSRNRMLRVTYQAAVIAFLGFINGHILSQAMFAGWSANSIPWRVAPGLVFLTLAALAVPIFSKRQPYCHHICPFGAIQQLAKDRIGWKLKLPVIIRKLLQMIPYVLLAFVVVVAVSRSTFNLAAIEPFDAFAYRVAGWTTISVFLGGLVFSLVSPMAYCHFGCPTGAVINFLRFRADSERLGFRDLAATSLLGVAIVIAFL